MKTKGIKRSLIISFIVGLIAFFFLFNLAGAQSGRETNAVSVPSGGSGSSQSSGTIISGGLVPCGNGNADGNLVEINAGSCTFQDLIELVNRIIKFLVIASSFVFVIIVVYAGWIYISSGGDTGKVAQAHKMFFNSVVGIIIVISAWLIIKMILEGLKTDSKFQEVLSFIDLLWLV
ncbi:hypothetical protein H6775_03545 [Candidatus Nomurabacteria bacterium]|nr:hypothetical protein [Candidatus Nomurabacteria bacterium]